MVYVFKRLEKWKIGKDRAELLEMKPTMSKMKHIVYGISGRLYFIGRKKIGEHEDVRKDSK